MKTIVYRLSGNGFESQYQNYHVDCLELGLKHFEENPNRYPEHLKESINNSYKTVIPEWKEFTSGIFSFVGSLPDEDTIRILTNHLDSKQKREYVWWSGEIDINQYAFDANNLWRTPGFKSIKELVENNYYEVFIPKQFLKIENIQCWSNDYRNIFHQSEENLLLNIQYLTKEKPKSKLKIK